MTESECLSRMVAPGQRRDGKPNGGVIQILVTSSCNLSCVNCTQMSQLRRKPWFMTPDQFDKACQSLQGYFGTVGVFGGNPCVSPHFKSYCEILRSHFPKGQCGLWSNALLGHGAECRITFNPARSNLNTHLDRDAYKEFKDTWPESMPFGLNVDSRHSPCYVAMKDVLKKTCAHCNGKGGYMDDTWLGRGFMDCEHCDGKGHVYDEGRAHELISRCDINQHWSAGIGVFRGELRAWFCEIAMAQSIYHQDNPEYPDTGVVIGFESRYPRESWWKEPMTFFANQVRKHCHECSVPLKSYGSLAQSEDGVEQVSETHAAGYLPKKKGRRVELITVLDELQPGKLDKMTDYLGNSKR
jgi:hypothetical protein